MSIFNNGCRIDNIIFFFLTICDSRTHLLSSSIYQLSARNNITAYTFVWMRTELEQQVKRKNIKVNICDVYGFAQAKSIRSAEKRRS